jgi:hypothetical protein
MYLLAFFSLLRSLSIDHFSSDLRVYSLVLLAETEPEKANAPPTINAIPVSNKASFEKKPLESKPVKEEPDKTKTANSKAFIAQTTKLTFRIQTDVTCKEEWVIIVKSMSGNTNLCFTLTRG